MRLSIKRASLTAPRDVGAAVVLFSVGVLGGCVGVGGDVDPGATRADEVLNGSAVGAEGSGYVAVVGGTNLQSGVLIRNSWVLTGDLSLPMVDGEIPLRVVMGSQSIAVDQIVFDLDKGALLHLSTPMTMRASTTGWRVDLWPGTSASLVGRNVTCYGYGNNTSTGGGGVLRSAVLPVTGTVTGGGYRASANALGQFFSGPGDVGAPCMVDTYLAGYHSTYLSSTVSSQRGAEALRDWVLDTVGERAVPRNNDRASAFYLTQIGGDAFPIEMTVAGSTAGATHDLLPSACNCTSGNDVWYRFRLDERSVVAFDTAGSEFDTSVAVTDAYGSPLSGFCNDDSGCSTGGFTSTFQSQTAKVLDPGDYFVAVGGCGAGRFFLHRQIAPLPGSGAINRPRVATNFLATPLSGNGTASGTLSSSSYAASVCGGDSSGEEARWFLSCGGQAQLFSLCRSDGGSYTRQVGSATFDPVIYLRTARHAGRYAYSGTYPDTNNVASGCNDDAIRSASDDCTGTGGDLAQYGSRLRGIPSARGINAIYIDARGSAPGMGFTLSYAVR